VAAGQQNQNQQHLKRPGHTRQAHLSLLGGYAVSTLSGALPPHQKKQPSNNVVRGTFASPLTVCVGTVTLASSPMGSIGADHAALQPPPSSTTTERQYSSPASLLSWHSRHYTPPFFASFWLVLLPTTCSGDIFIKLAGLPTPLELYVIWVLAKVGHQSPHLLRPSYTYVEGSIANAPLAAPLSPVGPVLMSMTLAQVNTFCIRGCWISWSMQALP
jgi:hypothetical protein